jgi:hypothetical protein
MLRKQSETVINEILDQQEIDQRKSWYQKMKFYFNLQLSILQNQKVIERERVSYFYSGFGKGITEMPPLAEKQNLKTGE